MAGLIADQMPDDAPAAPGAPTDAKPSADPSKRSPNAIMAMLELDPTQKQQLMRIVAAGMKVMFDAQSHHLMLDTLQGPGPLCDKIGQGVAGLMGMLMQESKNSLPPQLIVPAGLVLIAHAVDFLEKGGMTVSDEDFGKAVDYFVRTVMNAFGLDADKVAAIAGNAETQLGAGGDQAAAPEQGEA